MFPGALNWPPALMPGRHAKVTAATRVARGLARPASLRVRIRMGEFIVLTPLLDHERAPRRSGTHLVYSNTDVHGSIQCVKNLPPTTACGRARSRIVSPRTAGIPGRA